MLGAWRSERANISKWAQTMHNKGCSWVCGCAVRLCEGVVSHVISCSKS